MDFPSLKITDPIPASYSECFDWVAEGKATWPLHFERPIQMKGLIKRTRLKNRLKVGMTREFTRVPPAFPRLF